MYSFTCLSDPSTALLVLVVGVFCCCGLFPAITESAVGEIDTTAMSSSAIVSIIESACVISSGFGVVEIFGIIAMITANEGVSQ